MKKEKNNYLAFVINKNKKSCSFYILFGIIVTFLEVASSKFYEVIIDSFIYKNISAWIMILYSIILVSGIILAYFQIYPEQQLKHKLYYDFKLLALDKMQRIDYSAYQHLGIGKSTQQIEEGATAGRNIIFDFYARMAWEIIPKILISLIFIATIDLIVLILVLVSYLFIILITKLLLKKLYLLKDKLIVNSEFFNRKFIRGIMELLVFRINKHYKNEISTCENSIKEIVNMKAKLRMIHEAFFTIFGLITAIIQIGVLCYGLFFSSLSIGAIIALLALFKYAYQPIAIFNVIFVDFKLNKLSLNRYKELLNAKDDENLFVGENYKLCNGDISLKNISYSYGNKSTINDVSFSIKGGSTIALVGESGSGKTSIIKLLIGLNKLQQGEIVIDGQHLNKINLSSLYDYISYISQDSPVFDGTLRENIIFSKKVDDDEIIKVLEKVQLKDFYLKLPNGLDSELGERGILMSGGERQRVAIARLFFDNSKIIVLDEATSALDNLTELKIINTITNDLPNRTKIMIAHRLSTIKNVDEIFVIKNGQLIENGNFAELINKKQEFYQLYNANKDE